jgi:hypothetical protein
MIALCHVSFFALHFDMSGAGQKSSVQQGVTSMIIISMPATPELKARLPNEVSGRVNVYQVDNGSLHFGALALQSDTWYDIVWWVGRWEWFQMAAKTRYNTEFVNVRVPREDRDKVTQWYIDHETEFGDMLEGLVLNGYKVSVNQDDANDCVIVAFTGHDGAPYNRGMCMTSRAATPLEALYLGFYKHYVICDGKGWPEPENQDRSYG